MVQSLRNYRQNCTNALLCTAAGYARNASGKTFAWPGIVHACYRESRGQRRGGRDAVDPPAVDRWSPAVDLYFTPTHFARSKLIEGGLPADRIAVKPTSFRSDPGLGGGAGGYAAFVGRWSVEKGIQTLLDAWAQLERPPLPLESPATGRFARNRCRGTRNDPRHPMAGTALMDDVLAMVGDAKVLVMPSVLYQRRGAPWPRLSRRGHHRSSLREWGPCPNLSTMAAPLAVAHPGDPAGTWPRKSGSCSPTPRGCRPCAGRTRRVFAEIHRRAKLPDTHGDLNVPRRYRYRLGQLSVIGVCTEWFSRFID